MANTGDCITALRLFLGVLCVCVGGGGLPPTDHSAIRECMPWILHYTILLLMLELVPQL
jgi:hypothetical protein